MPVSKKFAGRAPQVFSTQRRQYHGQIFTREGSFSEIKDGMRFRRYRSRGKKNVLAESIIIAMARNLNKLHQKIQSGMTGKHLYELKEA